MIEAAELIRAFASLAWPVVALVALILFRPELRDFLRRIRRGKLLGQELEFDKALDQLSLSTEILVDESTEQRSEIPRPGEDRENKVVNDVLTVAAASPKAAFLLLSSELEGRLRLIFVNSSDREERTPLSIMRMTDLLAKDGILPFPLVSVIRDFWPLRNLVVHGEHVNQNEIFRAIDIGMNIMKVLDTVPVATDIVSNV